MLKDAEENRLYDELLEKHKLLGSQTLSGISANLVGQRYLVEGQIVGEKTGLAMPAKLLTECECEQCDEISLKDDLGAAASFFFKGCIHCPECHKPIRHKSSSEKMDYSVLYVRDIPNLDDKFTTGKQREWVVHLVGQQKPNSKTVMLESYLEVEPKSREIQLFTSFAMPSDKLFDSYNPSANDKVAFGRYFNGSYDLTAQIAPTIVGESRVLAKQAVLLQLHSPATISDIDGSRRIRGGINLVFIGDTKTGKSETGKDVTTRGAYPLGEYVVAETGKRTGLLYTIDTDRKAIVWGALPLNDLGLVVIDGLQAMTSEEMGEFREAIEQREVIVSRSQRGNAPARTRLLCLMNPGKKEEKPMSEYIHPCMAIKDSWVFAKNADITRFDLYLPFAKDDVSSSEIANRTEGQRPIPDEIFKRHVYWVWSRKTEQISILDDARAEIKQEAARLMEKYAESSLPVVHNGLRDVLLRIAAAHAALVHSTDDSGESIIVKKEHVAQAVTFYISVLDSLELEPYIENMAGKGKLTDIECASILKSLNETHWKILDALKIQDRSSPELASMLGVSDRTVKEHYDELRAHGLIETKSGKGAKLSKRGVMFVKLVASVPTLSELVKKSFTKSSDGEGKLHQFTNEGEEPLVVDTIKPFSSTKRGDP